MPRRAQGPLPGVWVIRDTGGFERSTRCGADRRAEAEVQLAEYIASKWSPDTSTAVRNRRDPEQVGVAEVLALYATERAPKLASDGATTAGFVVALLAYWGEKMLSEVKRSTCEGYVAWRTTQPHSSYKDPDAAPRISPQTAARELDLLSAAIGYWHGEDVLISRPTISKPEKPESPRDALSRAQAAQLLRASLGSRKGPDGKWRRLGADKRANRRHMRRFILIGLYTGTRPGVIPKLLWTESATQAWADLDKGVIWRKGKREREHKTKRRPMVKIPPRLLAHMRRWKAADEKLMEARRAKDLPTTNTILHHGGRPIRGRIRTGYEGCVRDAGLPAEITPHWQRHTAATWLMENGTDLLLAAQYLGMTVATLELHYLHHRPDYQGVAARAIGGRR
jgi:hypothetical protein